MTPTNADVGRTLTRLRLERNLSADAFARSADCTLGWLADAESGALSPTWTELGQVALALDLPVSTLIAEVEGEARARQAGRGAREDPPGPR